ncbi:MAG TPA: penicillin acylase family protein [Pyrinomonadaceae bacterium]|jgi:penicillin amidase
MKTNFAKLSLLAFFLFVSTVCFAQNLQVAGLKDSVTVRRDGRGIPYIEAKSDADLYFAQGYVTAQDRLWQMDLLRRVARGETAELFGKQALEGDKRWRKFGFASIVEETFKNFAPEHRAILENYARGVNAYIQTLDAKTLPVEFQLLQYRPAEWKPTDSMIIGAIISDGLSTTWWADVLKASFADLPKEKFDQLFTERSPFDVLVVGKDNLKSQKLNVEGQKSPVDDSLIEFALKDEQVRKSSLEMVGFYEEFGAMSNNFVVSGKRTLDGKPILANDPHLPPGAPSVWHMANLSAPGMRVSGVTFPGVPGIVLGHNEFIAWGATNLGPDVQDLYLETFNDKNQYQTTNGWQDAKIRKEEIKVRKTPTLPETEIVSMDVLETRNGVIIADAEKGAKTYPSIDYSSFPKGTLIEPLLKITPANAKTAYALKWTARDPKNDTFGAFLKLNRARNWDEFKAALKTYGGSTQNFIFADVKGNIGYYGAGAIPIRKSGDGSIPYDGWTNEGEWIKNIPFEEMPNSYNPAQGYIATANQRIAGESYNHFLTHLWSAPYRARRITQLLEANKKMTVNDAMDVQRDVFNISFSNFAREVVKQAAASEETLKVLRGWDGQMKADSRGALLVNEIRRFFLNKILISAVGAERAKQYRWAMSASFIDWLAAEKPADWLPKEFADYKTLLIASDKDARESLAKKYGADEANWIWGNIEKMTFPHPIGQANIPFVSQMFQIEPIPRFGSGDTPNVGIHVSMRHVTVPGDWDLTRQVIAPGESGDPKSPFWKDQVEQWKSGSTPIFPFSREAVEKAAKETIVFVPK